MGNRNGNKSLKLKITSYPFATLDWSSVPKEEHRGETGHAWWQVQNINDIRVRMVEYSAGYKADHWCKKGHIIFCVAGELRTELEDGRTFILSSGMCYFVGDANEAHRSSTNSGCKLFIVD